MANKLRVLFLPKWYPNRYDPMPGLFIQRQAEAITPYCDVAVIYVHPDPHCPNKMEAEFSEENEVRVLRVYYRTSENPSSLFGKALNLIRFYRAHRKAFHSIRQFSPEIVHAHILTRMGFVALRISQQIRVPLVISEHWSRYFPENNTYRGWLRKLVTVFVTEKASAVVAVSDPLLNAMKKCGLRNSRFRIIPNVVDMTFPAAPSSETKTSVKTMVHISCFDDRSKNISGFLNSIKALSETRQDFSCLMIGEGPDLADMKEYAGYLRIPSSLITFSGLKTGPEFAELLSSADFSVLSSRYETFGTVVVESLAGGVPVVATKVGVAMELINDTNGILVPPGDEAAMTRALNTMLDGCRQYDKSQIVLSTGDKFSRETIGKQLELLYRELLTPAANPSRS
jgi:glycosyltransferase involved in cell wall biosynthesis